ncbi:SCO4225 family membrane protein [Streptomyces lonarensis]|uniref:Uncharacterized protein n=1 Tax=Streptomyces lonarensis TaxID=700599 RepID=A0A7X6HXM3_9ACTN|nr:hypothetical protein [Streptomyces lonarensis]NJQ04319.1 hypothetical protein [Streptomyces lonarensis]
MDTPDLPDRPPADGPGRQSITDTLRSALSSPFARAYLGLVLVLLVGAALLGAVHTEDASLAGIWPVPATAPLSVAALLLPLPDGPFFLVAPVRASGLVNAVAIGWCHRTLGRRNGGG